MNSTLSAGHDAPLERSPGVWASAWRRLRRDRVGMAALTVTGIFVLMVLLALFGGVAGDWSREVAVSFAPPTFAAEHGVASTVQTVENIPGPLTDISDIDPLAPRYAEWAKRSAEIQSGQTDVVLKTTLPFGADQQGRDIIAKTVKGAQMSISVGLAAALFATLVGTLLGATGGYFGGKVDDLLEWVYNVFTAIPYILLVFSLAAVLKFGPMAKVLGNGIWTVVIILGLVGWTSIYRLIRAEYIKHRGREYVRAAEAIGASHAARMFRHILPNSSHVILVQLSLNVVAFIKTEVILSYLGLGVPLGTASWGTMLAESQVELVQGKWWQLVAATTCMAVFVTAFALLTDALRDALDPKLR